MKGYDKVLEALEQDDGVEPNGEYIKMNVADGDEEVAVGIIEEQGGVVNGVNPHEAGVSIVFEMETDTQ